MIVVDTSAILAILWEETESSLFRDRIAGAESALISAATRLEAHIVCLKRRGLENVAALDLLLARLQVVTIPFDEHQFLLARQAFSQYRQGRYGLNYGDCFSYALAKSRDLPLLFKGEDFSATDVKRAL
ncbi:type II toxin-antitoxin system VapC family toxin [Caulobacter sp. DWP3-1-3b2]|uniref:type II toxin-antitoxin system VapC family toxin n=1 Tax=unclassified Caulobacter TaxID=2648921 RepID=UPI003CFBB06B